MKDQDRNKRIIDILDREDYREQTPRKLMAAIEEVDGHAQRGVAKVNGLGWLEASIDRGDGYSELSGYEAETPFGTFYQIEIGADSFTVEHDLNLIGRADSPDEAKAIAQQDFEQRIAWAMAPDATALRTPAASEGPHPWYGPCDAIGPNGRCAECMKLSPAASEGLSVAQLQHIVGAHEQTIEQLREDLEALRAAPTKEEVELRLEVVRLRKEADLAHAEVVHTQDELGALLHAAEAKLAQALSQVEDKMPPAASEGMDRVDYIYEVERLQGVVELLEKNAGIQAKLLSDTARERDQALSLVENAREQFAKLAEDMAKSWVNGEAITQTGVGYQTACRNIAAAIRSHTSTVGEGK